MRAATYDPRGESGARSRRRDKDAAMQTMVTVRLAGAAVVTLAAAMSLGGCKRLVDREIENTETAMRGVFAEMTAKATEVPPEGLAAALEVYLREGRPFLAKGAEAARKL